ncbi:MAG: hypothetical protein WAL71_08385 [Terriglobales bacterium]
MVDGAEGGQLDREELNASAGLTASLRMRPTCAGGILFAVLFRREIVPGQHAILRRLRSATVRSADPSGSSDSVAVI